MKEPEGQLARWLEKLAEYKFGIIHRPGRLHTNADSLSRRPCRQSCPCKLQDSSPQQRTTSHQAVQCDLDSDASSLLLSLVGVETCTTTTAMSPVGVSTDNPTTADTTKLTETIYVTNIKETTLFPGWTIEELHQAQAADTDIAPIRSWLEASSERSPWPTVSPCSPATKTYWSQWKRLYLRDGVLVRHFYCLDGTQFYPQIVLPRKMQPDVMRQMHEGPVGGHFGIERTVARLRTRYYWYHMREDVALWCQTCANCACRSRPCKIPQAPMGTVRVGAPME